jgi:hypothetical protein
MRMWYVYIDGSGLVFEDEDNDAGKERVIEFLTSEMFVDYGIEADETDNYWVILGEEKTFMPPSSKGDLV